MFELHPQLYITLNKKFRKNVSEFAANAIHLDIYTLTYCASTQIQAWFVQERPLTLSIHSHQGYIHIVISTRVL